MMCSSTVPFAFFVLAIQFVASHIVQQSKGCSKLLPSVVGLSESKNLTIQSTSGVSPRKYRIHLPASYQTNVPMPLIFSFHGRNKDMEYQEQLSQFSNVSFGFEGIVVYPEGVPSPTGSNPKQWQGDPDAPNSINDIDFTLELLDHVLDEYCIDSTRVYASGKSNGGGFVGLLACHPVATQRFAAFAPVAAAFYLNTDTQQLPPCNPTSNRATIPILELHGAKDDTIKYTGGINTRGNANTTSVPDWVNSWARRNHLDSNANTTGRLCLGEQEVKTYRWGDAVAHYLYSNIEHDWPSQYGNVDTNLTTCKEADGTRVILDWFNKWTL